MSTPGAGKELSLDQPEGNLLDDTEKLPYQEITGSLMYLDQMARYDILYGVNQLARAISKTYNAHMGEAKRIFRYLADTINFDITHFKGGLP